MLKARVIKASIVKPSFMRFVDIIQPYPEVDSGSRGYGICVFFDRPHAGQPPAAPRPIAPQPRRPGKGYRPDQDPPIARRPGFNPRSRRDQPFSPG